MKIQFENKSYIEVVKSSNVGKIIVSIVAIDKDKPLTTIVSSVELTEEQFKELIAV